MIGPLIASAFAIALGCMAFGPKFLLWWVASSIALGLVFALFCVIGARRWRDD